MADPPAPHPLDDLCKDLEKEMRHRIGNSFQAITALTKSRAKAVSDPRTKAELTELATRVEAFAAAHANLRFQSGQPVMMMKEAIESLVNGLRFQHEVADDRVAVHVAPFSMDPDRGLPLVLILHELAAHSFKCHGAPEIRLMADATDEVARLSIVDLGFDLPQGVSAESGGSLGWDMIRLLVRQAGGSLLRPEGRADAVEITVPLNRP